MLSLEYIREESRKAAAKAAKANRKPLIFEEEDRGERSFLGKIPYIGYYEPEGYELVEKLFCDSSGFGADDEPALSVNQFMRRMRPGYGYAIIESGQFQVWIGEFRPGERGEPWKKKLKTVP